MKFSHILSPVAGAGGGEVLRWYEYGGGGNIAHRVGYTGHTYTTHWGSGDTASTTCHRRVQFEPRSACKYYKRHNVDTGHVYSYTSIQVYT